MAKNKNLVFLKSNYTLRKEHKTLKDGTKVLMRDYMVTTNNGGWDSGSIPYGDGNFKIIHRDDVKESRKHNYGDWLKNGDSEFWTMDDIQKQVNEKKSSTSDESRMNIKPVYSSLLDFAYFGNCAEMINAAVKNIITNYPGELYVTNTGVTYFDDYEQRMMTLGEDIGDLYLIENPYNIDVYSQYVSKIQKTKNGYKDLEYFCESRNKYKILDYNGENYCCDNRWITKLYAEKLQCPRNGDEIGRVLIAGDYDAQKTKEENFTNASDTQFVIYIFYANDGIVYMTDSRWVGYHIRPIDSAVDEFYKKLDDFEAFLLNRNTDPLYSITIDTMDETDRGMIFGRKTFTWPTIHGWNLDTETSNYTNYLNDLIKQASFYDRYYSDNLWRMMVHDSIKNMDLTFSNPAKNEDITDYNIGTTKVQGLFWAIARVFDDIKRYIDNIGSVNTITYSQTNNISDYLLTDKLELNGWETYDPTKTLDTSVEISGLYPGISKKYTLEDVKSLFYSSLNINTKDIFLRKGTRQGIEMVMALFGLSSYDYGKSLYMALPDSSKYKNNNGNAIAWDDLSDGQRQNYYDYELNEYVAVVSNTSDDVIGIDDEFKMETLNKLKSSYMDANEFGIPYRPFQGLPVKEVTVEVHSNDSDEDTYYKYLIPWFDKTADFDGNMYFQMYGGWGDVSFKKISESIAPDVDHIESDNKFKIYSETQKYLKYKSDLRELTHIPYNSAKNGDIYYVVNISDIGTYITGLNNPSNYFILINKDNYTEISDEGWKNIPQSDIEKGVFDGIKVLYLESIIDTKDGNNPHIGYGDYDNGKTYLDYFRQIFKYSIDTDTHDNPTFIDDAYDCETGELRDDIINCGFTVSDLVRDNMKVWYFTPDNSEPLPMLLKNSVEAEDEDGDEYTLSSGYELADFTYDVRVGKDSVNDGQTKLTTDLEAFNLETQENNSNSESAGDSVLNVKNLEIKFVSKFSQNEPFRDYLYNVVVPYLNQVIPSTTISKITIDGVDFELACKQYAEITGSVDEGYEKVRYFKDEFAQPIW